MLERLQRMMDYGMQALNLILVRFLQRKMTSKSVEHSLCEYFKFCRAAKGHLVETGNVESSISLNIYSNPFSLQVWWMGNSVSRWKLHRQMTNTSSSVLKIEENLWRSGKWYLNYLIFGA